MPLDKDNDFQAEMDMRTLINAQEIEKSPARLRAARDFAHRERDRFDNLSKQLPGMPKRNFNGAANGSKMKPK